MRHGSLFSGIGGFDLAAQWMGWQNMFHCEINPFANQILKYYWPEASTYHDIKKTDFTIHRGSIDILTGGFPCQPYSLAGARKGKEDERHLWPEMLRSVREIAPRWVVGENVFGLLNWNGGLVFDEVQADMEAEGYEVWPFVLPACGIDAPHRRDRIWFVAYSGSHGSNRRSKDSYQPVQVQQKWHTLVSEIARYGKERPITHTNKSRWEKQQLVNIANAPEIVDRVNNKKFIITDTLSERGYKEYGFRQVGQPDQKGEGTNWQNWPTQSPVCTGNDGISGRLDFKAIFADIKHPRQPARAHGKWRNESIKGAGNAIVPGVVHQIFKAIELYEFQLHTAQLHP